MSSESNGKKCCCVVFACMCTPVCIRWAVGYALKRDNTKCR
uniref:Uncharacterized protein n=1 Tax=Anopheles quadriannulatus TaxID=34691 RepID=A0A182XQS9_ANOQN